MQKTSRIDVQAGNVTSRGIKTIEQWKLTPAALFAKIKHQELHGLHRYLITTPRKPGVLPMPKWTKSVDADEGHKWSGVSFHCSIVRIPLEVTLPAWTSIRDVFCIGRSIKFTVCLVSRTRLPFLGLNTHFVQYHSSGLVLQPIL